MSRSVLVEKDRAQGVLKKVFGYDRFRPMQEDIIETLIQGKDSLVIMPTGGGKSICYQIPAILMPGLTIVVSPLISLMQDQVQQLKALGVSAEVLNSSLKQGEYRQVLSKIHNRELVMLYMAPETLMKPSIREMLEGVEVSCLTIDEAHCISEWGHDFRPEYRQMAELRNSFPNAACIALTATATDRVREDIRKSLKMGESQVFISSFDRKNLLIQAEERHSGLSQILSFIKDFPDQSGIIYGFSRRRVDELTAQLKQRGFSALPYHAGLSDKERQENQDLFIKDEVQIMVATIAFGMGINKPNVRFVIHHDLPRNVESYYQQIGRAGRDGLDSQCLLLFQDGDRNKIRYFIDQMEEDSLRRAALDHLDHMVDFAETARCRRIDLLQYFGEKYEKDNCGMCDNCLNTKQADEDITLEAQKYLSCIARTGERFGAAYITDVLRGADTEKIRDRRHKQLSTYGIGKDLSKKQWANLSRQFLRQGLIRKDEEYGHLLLGPQTGSLFRGEIKVKGVIPVDRKKISKQPKGSAEYSYDHEVFDRLRTRRKELATAESVPPYVIFSDRTLMELAQDKPRSREALLGVSGVGLVKLEKYGEAFLKALHGDDEDFSNLFKENEEKKSRTERIGEMFNSGVGLGGLHEQFRIRNTALIKHLTEYAEDYGTLDRDCLDRAISLDEDIRLRALHLIEEWGESRLKQIQEELGGSVSVNQLKLLCLMGT